MNKAMSGNQALDNAEGALSSAPHSAPQSPSDRLVIERNGPMPWRRAIRQRPAIRPSNDGDSTLRMRFKCRFSRHSPQQTDWPETPVKAVLFDFDGTLANSLPLGYEVMQTLCDQHGFKTLPQEAYRSLPTRDLIKQMGIPLWSLPRVMKEGRELMASKICEVQPVDALTAALKDLTERGIILGIVTSNSSDNVRAWLSHHGLASYFGLVRGGGKLLRKERCIKRCLRILRLKRRDAVYVGDEVRDINASLRLGIRPIAVTWGLDRRNKLEKSGPYSIIDAPAELVDIVDKLSRA